MVNLFRICSTTWFTEERYFVMCDHVTGETFISRYFVVDGLRGIEVVIESK